MKIINFIASVDMRQGGPVEGLRITGEELGQRGHVVEAASLDDPAADHVARFPVKTHATGPGMLRGRVVPGFSRWVREHADDYDVAVVHGLWNPASFGGHGALKQSGLPYVVFSHGMMDPWFNEKYPLKNVAKQAFWLAIQGPVLRDAHSVLFTSEEERRLARTSFHRHDYRERVVAFGAADAPDRPAAQAEAFAAALPELSGRRYLLFLSRIHPKKGCDLLVKAFAATADLQPDLDIVIAGPDQVGWRAELEPLAASFGIGSRIHWPGMLEGDAKWGAFRGADAFVLPSHQENFGIVVAEAMACHTPVLITDKVNIWREIETSGGGLVETDTEAGIERMLRAFLALPTAARREMGERAREGYERFFGTGAAAEDLLSVLHEAIETGTR
ncbi:transferase [Kaistia algarum]|uniref:glycosyltransferase n=1 Tax=Kaistia algarum TaxID=2083279 RepID=UPI000CE91D44|nr:glycosyltransferase [Kaistia algarum]MCX5516785.1 glycosyltransferase [Kaistia algarum]PPE77203.1 transferase [Kaistia algarum]